jgi:hypothetical protein
MIIITVNTKMQQLTINIHFFLEYSLNSSSLIETIIGFVILLLGICNRTSSFMLLQ